MAVAYDSVGAGSSTENATVITWQHVLTSSATCIVVGVNFENPAGTSLVRSVKIGNATMTSLGTAPNNYGWIQLFALMSPPTGVQSVTVTTATSSVMSANSVAYSGVTSLGTATTGSSGSIPMTITTAPPNNGMAVMVTGTSFSQGFYGWTGTQRWLAQTRVTTTTIQDAPGTGSPITLSVTASTNAGWGAVAVNLSPASTAPSPKTAAATLAITATPTAATAGERGVGAALPVIASPAAALRVTTTIAASLAVTATPVAAPPGQILSGLVNLAVTATYTASATVIQAPIPPPAARSPLRYVGRLPDRANAVSPRKYVNDFNDSTKVTLDFINKALDIQVPTLASLDTVIQEDAKRATKAEVLAADNAFFPATGHNLAMLDSAGVLVSTAVPTTGLIFDRTFKCYTGTSNIGGNAVASGSSPRNVLLATCNIPDPGYPYTMLPFAVVAGGDPSGTQLAEWSGTGRTGRLLAMPPAGMGEVVYGAGVCTATDRYAFATLVPALSGQATPASTRRTGASTLCLFGSTFLDSATSFTFIPSGLAFHVYVVPVP